MRVLQLIDSLAMGGAERVAVNYANVLHKQLGTSFLCATRVEGGLRKSIDPEVGYLFLNRKSTLDFFAVLRLKKYIKKHGITIVQAHGSSWFIAVLVKWITPGFKLVWHNHYGKNKDLGLRQNKILARCSSSFDAILNVSQPLADWAKTTLGHKNVHYIKNFVMPIEPHKMPFSFCGTNGKRIICVANLRPQKNHGMLLDAMRILWEREPEATLHLFGANFQDEYAKALLLVIDQLGDRVFYHGAREDVASLLGNFDMGVLSSHSEGLPLSLLEYGQAALSVVVTGVGECEVVLGGYGHCVQKGSAAAFAKAMRGILKRPEIAILEAQGFQRRVAEVYGVNAILPVVLNIYEQLDGHI